MKKKLYIVSIFTAFLVLGTFLFSFSPKKEVSIDKLVVVSTLFPLHDFARIIGGEKVEASLLLPPGVESHSFEPKPSDIARINKADIFIYAGEFMEPWAHDIIASLNKNTVTIIDASAGIKLIEHKEDKHEEDEYEEEHAEAEHAHHHEGVDPHFWLDFENVKIVNEKIAATLIGLDTNNQEYYSNNKNAYNDNLDKLDNSYIVGLASCRDNKIIYGGHFAFGYLAEKYDLEYIAAQGFSPDSEPTAKDLIALIEQIKQNGIEHVFYEELTSPKIAETIAQETGAKMLLLNAAHNLSKDDYDNQETFLSIMEKNLKNLRVGLRCQE